MNVPFLTELDSRAEVKGSRDPLGLMAVWAHFGRKVVGNLTTITSSVRGFTTLLLGLYFAEKLQETTRDARPSALETFLKFEQLAGYARMKVHGDSSVRGEKRIRARLSGSKRIRISAAADDQILSNQKVYGLWGLFTVPARTSALLIPREPRLTDEARAFVDQHYRHLITPPLLQLLKREWYDFDPNGRDKELTTRLADAHGTIAEDEKAFYREHLAWGGPEDSTAGKQRLLADLVSECRSETFGYKDFREVRNRAARSPNGSALVESLDRIDALESLINPARVVFGFLLTQNGQTVDEVAQQVAGKWSRPPKHDHERIEAIRPEILHASWPDAATRWLRLSACLRETDYRSLIATLVEINTDVMQRRNQSAAWLAIEGGRLRVRMSDEKGILLPPHEVEILWRSTYFINALWAIAREVA